MCPVLQIQIGASAFLGKEISHDKAGEVFSNLLKKSGIDVETEITITDNQNFLTINGYICQFPESLIKEADGYMQFLHTSDRGNFDAEQYWEFVINHIVWFQPSVIFPNECLPDFMPALLSLPRDKYEDVKDKCEEIVAELLHLKIPLTNKALITEISHKYLNTIAIEWNDFREELIESLMLPKIAIYFNPEYFDHVSTAPAKENLFEMMRDGMFYETGVKYPPFKFLFDNRLPYNAFYFQINNFISFPVMGLLNKEEMLVNDKADNLYLLGISAREAVNPANGNKAGIIKITEKEKAETNGLTTWDGLGYFILCFSSFLRKYGYLCIDRKLTSQYLESLNLIYPKTCSLLEKNNLVAVCAKTLRLLAKEEISVRNLRVIVEAILDSDYIIIEDQKYIIFDERLPVSPGAVHEWKNKAENVVEYVRTRMKKYISHKYTKGQSTLLVYLLDPEIEKLVRTPLNPFNNVDKESISKIRLAIKNEIVNTPPSSQFPVILTTVSVRPYFKKIVELNFPEIAVLSYQELSPEMNIQPIARIAFN